MKHAMNTPERHVECPIPILPVSDLALSTQSYKGTLGLHLDWSSDSISSVSRDHCATMLSETGNNDTRASVWIGVEDDALFHVYREKGAR